MLMGNIPAHKGGLIDLSFLQILQRACAIIGVAIDTFWVTCQGFLIKVQMPITFLVGSEVIIGF